MVKLLDFDAEYSPSKRSDTWLKVIVKNEIVLLQQYLINKKEVEY